MAIKPIKLAQKPLKWALKLSGMGCNRPNSTESNYTLNSIIYLGLDLSTTASGWAVLNDKMKLIDYGVVVPDPKGQLFDRIIQIRNEIVRKLILFKPTFVAIEDLISMKFGRTAKVLNYLNGVIACCCYEYNGNDVYFIASSSLKKAIGVNPMALKKDGFDREGIKEICFKKISELFRVKLRNEMEIKYKFDIADSIACVYKLYQNTGGKL